MKRLLSLLFLAAVVTPGFTQQKNKTRINWSSIKYMRQHFERHPSTKYVLLHIYFKERKQEIPDAPDLVRASQEEWMFTEAPLERFPEWKTVFGVGDRPVILGCDRHLNEFVRVEEVSPDAIRKILRLMPLEVAAYEKRLKEEYEGVLASLKEDDREATLKALVKFLTGSKGDFPEVRDAIERIDRFGEEDFQKAELAMSLSEEEGIEYLREMAALYKTSPPGAHAELRIAQLDLEGERIEAAAARLKTLRHTPGFYLREIHRKSRNLLIQIHNKHPEVLAKLDAAEGAVEKTASRVKVEVPSEEARSEAVKIVQGLFEGEYARARSSSQERIDLSGRLLAQGRKTRDDVVAQYVLFDEARGLAADAGHALLALEAVEEILGAFKADVLYLMSDTLDRASRRLNAPEMAWAVAEGYIELAGAAVAEDDYTVANSALSKAGSAARKVKDSMLLVRIKEVSGQVSGLRWEYARVRSSHAKLKEAPDDPDANQAYGTFLCMVKGDWGKGLLHLAKGSDPELKKVAASDIAAPSEPMDQVEVADGWWDLAEKERSDTRKKNLVYRARHWYELAVMNLSGLSKLKVENRLETARKATAPQFSSRSAIDLLSWIDLRRDTVSGLWRTVNRKLVSPQNVEAVRIARLEIPCIPPDEYDLGVKVERKSGDELFFLGLVAEGRQFTVVFDFKSKTFTSFMGKFDGRKEDYLDKSFPSDKLLHQGAVLTLGRPTTLVCSIRKKSFKVTADGKTIFEWKNPPYPTAKPRYEFRVRNEQCLFLGCRDQSVFEISGINLVTVSGTPQMSTGRADTSNPKR